MSRLTKKPSVAINSGICGMTQRHEGAVYLGIVQGDREILALQ